MINKKIKKSYIPSALFYLSLLGTFFFYTQGLDNKIDILQQANTMLEKKELQNMEVLHKIQIKLRTEEKKVQTLENILNTKMMQTLSKNKHLTQPIKKHFFIQKNKVNIETLYYREKREAQTLKEDLERQLSQIFAQNKNLQQHYAYPNNIQKLVSDMAKNELNKKYVWGAEGPVTYDCSGLTQSVYEKLGIKIPRVSKNQAKHGKYIERENLQKGDLIFFDTSKERKGIINHVGIYLGNNKFIHASSASKSVVITNLNKPFYDKSYKWARRVIDGVRYD